jgi:hypothetical protein
MTTAKSLSKKVLQKKKNQRRSLEGQPKAKTKRKQMFLMMKDFNKFVARKMSEGVLVDHKDVGLPDEITGEDIVGFNIEADDKI